MTNTPRINFAVMTLMMTMMMAVVVMVVVAAAAEEYRCQQMRGECRLVVWEDDGELRRNISCYCKYGEDVSRPLHQLSAVNCMRALGPQQEFSTSILRIVGCNVTSQPTSLLAACRESKHLSLHVEGCPWVSLAAPATLSARASAPTIITATFLNSQLSGMPEGVVSGAGVQADVRVEGCHMGVVESRSFSGYAHDAQVSVTFRDTEIYTVKQGAFDLPPTAQMEMEGGKILKFEYNSISGGAEITLNSMRVANLMHSSINIYGLKKLSVTNCTMATVYADALGHRPPTYVRNITTGLEVLKGSEAVFSDNRFIKGNGEAFAQLCTVESVVWHNNTMVTFKDMPLRLQGRRCTTHRDWTHVFSLNGMSCQDCADFMNPDRQTCGLFESGYCISCEKEMDQCNKPILPYLTSKCLTSHPAVARALNTTCGPTTTFTPRTSRALQGQSSATAVSLTPLLLVVTLGVMMLRAVVPQ